MSDSPKPSFSKDPDGFLDAAIDAILDKVEGKVAIKESSKRPNEPVIEGTHLLCAGQDLTVIPEKWGKIYGETIKYIDLSYNCLTDVESLDLFQKLETLVLDNNELGDQIKFPVIPSLKTLCINNNNISSFIPIPL